MRESLEAKGLLDYLGSLSDDEGVESEEEDGEEEEGNVSTGERTQVREAASTSEREVLSPTHPLEESQPVSRFIELAASS